MLRKFRLGGSAGDEFAVLFQEEYSAQTQESSTELGPTPDNATHGNIFDRFGQFIMHANYTDVSVPIEYLKQALQASEEEITQVSAFSILLLKL